MCRNEVDKRFPSPDAMSQVVLFSRSCGATTSISTHVALLGDGIDPGQAGNAFIAEPSRDTALGEKSGVMPIDVRWNTARKVVMSYPASARVFRKETRIAGVDIEYVLIQQR